MPNYDPAIAANILSALAFALGLINLYFLRKTERERKSDETPEISSQIKLLKNQPNWYVVRIRARNILKVEAQVARVTLIGPRGVLGLHERDATRSDSGRRRLLGELPTDKARKTISIELNLAPAGNPRSSYSPGVRDTERFLIYVRSELPGELIFAVSCIARRNDTRLEREMISMQRINLMLPPS